MAKVLINVTVQAKKYTEQHEWIELGGDGSTGIQEPHHPRPAPLPQRALTRR